MKLFLPAFHSLMPPQRGRVIRRDHCLVFLAQVSRLMTNLVPFSLFDKQGIWETGSGTRARITCSWNAGQRTKRADPSEQWHPEDPEPGRASYLIGNSKDSQRGLQIQGRSSGMRKPEKRTCRNSWPSERWCSGLIWNVESFSWVGRESPGSWRQALWLGACLFKITTEMVGRSLATDSLFLGLELGDRKSVV